MEVDQRPWHQALTLSVEAGEVGARRKVPAHGTPWVAGTVVDDGMVNGGRVLARKAFVGLLVAAGTTPCQLGMFVGIDWSLRAAKKRRKSFVV